MGSNRELSDEEQSPWVEISTHGACYRLHRPGRSPIEYDGHTDMLTIGGVQFSPQLLEDLVRKLDDGDLGPAYFRREGDTIEITSLG